MSPRPDVVVVGAGIVGLSIAFHLRERGASVTVLDRAGIGAGASGLQPGGVRRQWGTRTNCLLVRESLEFYADAVERLQMRVDPGFRACGYLFLAHSEAALARLGENVALQNGLGVHSRIVSPAEAAELVPDLDATNVVGGSWCGEDGYFDRPQAFLEAFGKPVAFEPAATTVYGLTFRRLWATTIAVLALVGVVIGGLALARPAGS